LVQWDDQRSLGGDHRVKIVTLLSLVRHRTFLSGRGGYLLHTFKWNRGGDDCRIATAVLVFAASLAPGLWGPSALAQTYPTKLIKLVAPFPAGGPVDVLGRVLTQKLAESFGNPVVVDNRAGADGIIGTDFVAKSAPDGYTMLMNSGSATINAHVYPKLPYDLLRDFAPVTMVAAPAGLVLVAHPSSGVNSVKELIALAKQKPGQISFSSSGNGSALQLAGELFGAIAGIQLVHVPYKGAAPAFNDLLSGQVQLMFPSTVSMMAYLNSGRLRVLAQTGTSREPGLPNVPTLVEEGFGDFNITGWFGIWVPARTPDAIIRRLHAEIARALMLADVRERFSALGVRPSGMSPEEFGTFVREDYERMGKYIKRTGMHLE
jgi:tripartite-type tricarboxylate transporter receptor subunit TctC